jgi:SAM-dependent methyltransferase
LNNYEFCASFAEKWAGHAGHAVLDYGCGRGQIVSLLRSKNIKAFGCDVFYEGGSYQADVNPAWLQDGTIRKMESNDIPFPDASFDVAISNQVFEHVPDLENVAEEIARVLKPGGMLLCLFPDASCWREGHCGIPFIHWFPKHSKARIFYAYTLRALGFGLHKDGKNYLQWSRDFCDWLDKWTYYRRYDEIEPVLSKYFSHLQHIEPAWFTARTGGWNRVVPSSLKRFIVIRWAGLVFCCVRR